MPDKCPQAEHTLLPEQLCVGLHVHLDLPWTAHPFTFSSFKIKTQAQVSAIQELGLPRIRYTPERSDCAPLPPGPPDTHAPPPAAPQRDEDPAVAIKRERMQRLAAQRARAGACEKALLSAARTVKAVNQNVFARPQEVLASASSMIQDLADSMLVDADVSIQLMADKVSGEDVHFHALNVALLSMMLAKELKASASQIHMVGMAGLFHDIGELEIPDRVLRAHDARTRAETALFQMHGEYGVQIGKKLGLNAEVLQVIAQHHEKVDGSGYPLGLRAAQMSLMSRIVSVVNAYDELCNPPDAGKALTPHEALSLMFSQQRQQFDPLALSTFVRCMGVYPPGTIVVLSNGAIAMVVSVNTSKPLRPVVLVHDPAVPRDEAIVVDLEAEQDVSITRTMRPQQLSVEAFAYLSPRKRMTCFFDTAGSSQGA